MLFPALIYVTGVTIPGHHANESYHKSGIMPPAYRPIVKDLIS